MRLKSPSNLHYPITVTGLLKHPEDGVELGDTIFSYSYISKVFEGREPVEVERKWPANFESDVEGTITQWCIEKGTVIEHANVDLVEVEEACSHSTQFGGLCVMCGKDMTEITYAQNRPDAARASTNVAHAHKQLRISSEEAARMDQEQKRKLLGARKLSLVVDLDLTIIQATVDPTIGEWQNDKNNPNYEAVKGVRSFELRDDALGRNVAYYVKMRPGLVDFLQQISQMFELHIYTMGTRNYAIEIAKIVDPDHKLFADRILSRTETPGEDSKNLRKLFPVDTKMVVIIDDRIDVWRNSPYLVKVTPYNFFTGIGDIHGAFLDRKYRESNIASAAAKSIKEKTHLIEPVLDVGPDEKVSDAADGTLEQFVSMRNNEDVGSLQEKTAAAEKELSAQLSDRPLLQQQMALEKAEEEAEANGDDKADESGDPAPALRHSLLQDNDRELEHLGEALTKIHSRFYELYDDNSTGHAGRVGELRNGSSPKKKRLEDETLSIPDVKAIIHSVKSTVLKRCFVVPTESPEPEFKAEQWDDINAELADFLEDGSDSEVGTNTDAEQSDDESDTSSLHHKRKRDVESDGEAGAEAPQAFAAAPDSKLQRRKRQALERTSSLTRVTRAPETPIGRPEPRVQILASSRGPEEEAHATASNDSEEDEADYDASLEAELAAATDDEEDGE
ncbi:hypothetical protein FH972_022885 [Carpinus fangiana]|uniref:RNA polymerase II C-terminal domain phosphatase-like n=1 Tax=Carpinus fangiana TaxID=176857 RepID=A0A5N6KTJ4_9ROSI|nr:hypothetical protein FH972_022885 [Carpinus fangiana]